MSHTRKLLGLGLVLVGVGILAVGAWVLLRPESDPEPVAVAPDLTFVTAVRSEMASRVDGDATTLESPTDFSLWWIDSDDHAIANDFAPAAEFRAAVCETDDLQQNTLRTYIRQLTPAIDAVMQAQGFSRNLRNSSRNFFDDRFYDYIRAYERGPVKAVFSASPDCWSRTGVGAMYYSLTFAYTLDYAKNAKAQVPYLDDLRLGSDVVIHVAKRQMPWAVVNVNYRRTGHYIIAKRISGAWMQVFAGQDMPSCDLVNTWKIPASITECYTEPAA